MLLLDRILTLIVNRISNTSYHLQYLYCQGGYAIGAKPNLITCVTEIFLSVENAVYQPVVIGDKFYFLFIIYQVIISIQEHF